MAVAAEETFAPPGPGVWFLETTHWTRPVTRFHSELFPKPFRRGFAKGLRRYGSLLAYLDFAFVNGFPYWCPRPVGSPEDAVGHPPREVWEEIAASDPEVRARLRTSETVFEQRLWRGDLERWDGEVKPAAIRGHVELLEVEPDALDTAELLVYMERCRENQIRGAYVHHLFNVATLLPVGDFAVNVQEWTGRPAAEAFGLLQGATPNPLGAADELERVAQALRGDARARALVVSPRDPGELLAALRAFPSGIGRLAGAYIDRVGYRPVNGEDVCEPSVIELPELIVWAIRSAVDAPEGGDAGEELARRTAELRDSVPADRRAEFDALLAEARSLYRLRDERASYADLWAIGIMRRALLAAGRRLTAAGRIHEPGHLVEADYAELRQLVEAGAGPSADELAERARYGEEARYADAPPVIGGQPGDPLPPEWLPPSSARLERALGAAVEALFLAPPPRTEEGKVHGLGVSPGVYEGIARVIRGTDEFGQLERGDVLVTNSTNTAFNIVLPLLGAIVTDRGGLLSHAAIVAREFGLAAVVGTTDATQVIPDGARVRVDGTAGEVEIVG
jgi:phosphohistidine swiveling domain-containing protein